MFQLQDVQSHQVTFFSKNVWKDNERVALIVEYIRQTPMIDFGSTTFFGYVGTVKGIGDEDDIYNDWLGVYHSVKNPPPLFSTILEKSYTDCSHCDKLFVWNFQGSQLLLLDFERSAYRGYEED